MCFCVTRISPTRWAAICALIAMPFEAVAVSPTISVVPSPSPAVSGQPVIVGVTVTGVGELPTPTGTVQLQVNGITYSGSSMQLSPNGTATLSIPGPGVPQPGTILFVAPGACNIGAPAPNTVGVVYSGDMNYSATTAMGCLTVVPALTVSPNPAVYGQPVTYTATVDSLLTGAVTFFDGTTSVDTSAPISSGQVSFSPPLPLTVGTHTITASFVEQVSSPAQLQINKANTTTLLTFSQNGTMVTFSATVTPAAPGAGTPSGSVQFFNGTSAMSGAVGLSGGSATFMASNFAGNITAMYSSDNNFNGSTSNSVPVDALAASSITLSSSQTPSVFGQPVTLSATITTNAVNPPRPGGTVQFLDGSTPIGAPVSVMNSYASVVTSALSVGTHNITAQYSGDSFYSTASASTQQVVNKASTSTSLTFTLNAPSVTFIATVAPIAPGAGTPTGSVQFMNGNSVMETVPLTGSKATFTASNVTGTITAVYLGDSNFNGSTSSPIILSSGTVSVLVTGSPAVSVFGQPVTLSAAISIVTQNGSAPTGTVQFLDGSAPIGSAPVANAAASITTSALTVGTHTITAQYSGDTLYSPASGTAQQVVNKADTSTSLSYTQTGASITLTASVAPLAPGNGTPTGSVQFMNGANLLGTVSLSESTATLTTSNISGTITAVYSGDSNFDGSTSKGLTFGVPGTANVLLSANPSTSVFGQPVTFTITVSASSVSGPTPTGNIQLFDGSTFIGSVPLVNGAGFATTSLLAVGTHIITANYSGDSVYSPASGTAQPVVNKSATSATLSYKQNGATVTFTATVTPVPPGAGTPSGTVQFVNGTAALGSSQLTNLTATISASGISGTVIATYSGDTNFTSSTSNGIPIGPAPPSPPVTNTVSVSISSSLNPSNLGQPVTFTAGVSVVTGSGSPTGSIQFLDGGAPIGGSSLSGGSASVTISTLTVGSHAITAQYSGDAFFPGGSATIGQVVNRIASILNLGASPGQVTTAQSLTLAAQVGPTPPAGIPGPTGQISFSDGGTPLGSASVAGAAASIALSSLTAGTHQFSASYSGDMNYTAASASASVVVTLAPVTITTSSLSNGTVTQIYTGALGAQGGVKPYTWSIGGLPPGLTADSSGNITGIPTDTGTYTLSVQVTDSKGSSASSSNLTITVVALPLTISANLPGGQQGMNYSGSISVSGGVPPYKVAVSGLPTGLTYSSGSVSGQPTYSGSSTVTVQATDSKTVSASQSFTINIASTSLTITTSSLANGTAGQPYSQQVMAVGGAPPYTWSASLPSNLSIDPNTGIISGTPYVGGQVSITVTVTDTAKGSASSTYTVTLALPSTIPQLIFTGLEDSEPAQTEPTFGVKWASTFPADVQGTITLTFQPSTGADSGEVMFANGTRTIKFTILANTIPGVFTDMPAFQTGTVAGAIALTVDLKSGGMEITPQPPPIYQLQIPAGPPVITSLTATFSSSTLTVSTTGYSTTRELTQAVFTFNPATGANLQTTTLTVPLSSLFAPWFSSNQVVGSQFLYTQQFTIQGSNQAIASVTVTLANTQGNSQSMTANVQ